MYSTSNANTVPGTYLPDKTYENTSTSTQENVLTYAKNQAARKALDKALYFQFTEKLTKNHPTNQNKQKNAKPLQVT
jgi:hypothetical protein